MAGVLAAAVLAVLVLGAQVGLDRYRGIAQLTGFRTQITVGALVGVLLVLRWWRSAALPVLLVVVVSLVGVVPRLTSEIRPGPGAELVVLAANVLFDRADPEALAATVTERDVDVVALPEASERYATELARMLPGYSVGANPARPFGAANTSMLVRTSLKPRFGPGPSSANSSSSVRIEVDGREVEVVAVHPTAPFPGNEGPWRRDLAALRERCARATPTILLGDFNATLDHSGFRDLVGAGCTDVGAAAGDGLVGTWPQRYPRALSAAIDHVLLAGDGLAAGEHAVLDSPGSDHRAVLARLRLAPA